MLLYANEIERVRQRQGPSSTANRGWGREKNNFFCFIEEEPGILGGRERERSLPLPQIMLPSFPHLGKSQGSAQPKCNGKASPWRNCLDDHSVP